MELKAFPFWTWQTAYLLLLVIRHGQISYKNLRLYFANRSMGSYILISYLF